MHDVDESGQFLGLAACQLHRQADFLLVVEGRAALVGIQPFLVVGGDLPDRDRNDVVLLRFDGQVRAGLAALVEQFVIGNRRDADGLGCRAAVTHLADVQV